MTEQTIREQIQTQLSALKRATDNATKSKEAANKYLQDAGINSDKKELKFDNKKK